MNTAAITATRYQSVVQKTKRLLLRGSAGVNGMRSLSRALGIAEDCGGSTTTASPAFVAALAECGVTLPAKDVETVFAVLDRGGEGNIDPAEFIAALRADLTPLRRTWVRRVWASFPKDTSGSVRVPILQAAYRAEMHPAVVRGARTADEVRVEFETTFNDATNPDGMVTLQEFEEYCAGVSAATDDEDGFVALLRGVWPMRGVSDSCAGSPADDQGACALTFSAHQSAAEKKKISQAKNQQAELLRMITQDHRPRAMESALAARQLSLALQRACLSAGAELSFFISPDELMDALKQCRLYVSDPTALAALDTCCDGSVDVLYYLELVFPAMPAARQLMLERLWQRVFPVKDTTDRVDVKQFQRQFVVKGAEERSAFLSAWDVREAVHGKVSLAELKEWYAPRSAKLQLDKDFESLLGNEWKDFSASD